MAGVEMTVEIDRDDRRRIDAMFDRFTDKQQTRLLKLLADAGEEQTRTRIRDQEGPPNGGSWAPLSPDYVVQKRKRSTGGILSLTGNLEDSIEAFLNPDGEAGWGSRLEYSAIHQFGGRHIQARPYLGISQQNLEDMEAIATEYYEKLIAAQ